MRALNAKEIVGSDLLIAEEDGEKLLGEISRSLEKPEKVVVIFDKDICIISAFMNVAFGRLYERFSEEQVRAFLSVQGLSSSDLRLLKVVVDNAKEFYRKRRLQNAAEA